MLRSWIFFYGSGDNRDLHVPTHSFPTRRSSELRALHDSGGRRDGPFVAINCGAVPAEIIESELFGHVAGAFTGAQKPRTGKLEFADGGTVRHDEIESMPPALQVKLLRAIETRPHERRGHNVPVPPGLRLLGATKEARPAAR